MASSSASSSAIRRLPVRQAISSLTSGEGSTSLPSRVKGLRLSFVSKNSPSGPREFVRTIAPRLAYANPTLPFHIDRLRDPRSKALDKKSPDAGVGAWEGGMPKASLRVEIEGEDAKSIDINALSPSEILSALYKAAGGPVDVMAGQPSSSSSASASGQGEGATSMAEMLAQGADTTYADIGKEPLVGETPLPEAPASQQ
ncbi:uncharacterized protein MKK02DRAFT_43189 [Dioszegia hungarica]|uniref:Ribosomal protein/NADH dehydrogenase domain-containing protein n=1 Tax=Dioszegia hungarica TaxID=4972 RepID=A0AA38HBR9_9TREE|nr:uncharacterized protein MKK02DRAFT_43189 [Dioszegia hungarica]KAI9637265.1 hypothetical protein MKK02DRAFT_43189 [Dioszegia hungarica]